MKVTIKSADNGYIIYRDGASTYVALSIEAVIKQIRQILNEEGG